MTANASSSSVASPPERPDSPAAARPRVDLAAAGLLAPLPAAFLAGRDADLLAPLSFVPPGTMPELPPPPAAPARRDLAAALAVANRAYGHPGADRLARRLADPATRVVVTGQQPGLFGSPLYAFAKMVAASRWAAALEAAGEPAVAVFWVATEDHDWSEISAATFPTPSGPRTFDLGPDPEPLAPAGMRTLGPGVAQALAALAEATPGEPYARWLETLGRWYRPDARFGEAFSRLMPHLLGERCPLLLDAMDPALKAAERPWLRRLVERRREAEETYAAADAEVVRRGYPLQVAPQRGSSPLFLLRHGERRRIEWRDDGQEGMEAGLRGRPESLTIEELLRTIEENPGVVSPGVLARSAVQDAVLGTSLQVLGPGELSYMAQAAAVYPVLEVEAPAVALRPQTVVLEPRELARLEETGLDLADLLAGRAELDRRLARLSGGEPVAPVREAVARALEELRAVAQADPNLERPLEKTREQVLRALDLFAEKAAGAAARRDEVASRRVDQLREAVLPLGSLQERTISSAHFPGRHGEQRFAEAYWEQLDLDPRWLQVISP